jgi:hypothetical protein
LGWYAIHAVIGRVEIADGLIDLGQMPQEVGLVAAGAGHFVGCVHGEFGQGVDFGFSGNVEADNLLADGVSVVRPGSGGKIGLQPGQGRQFVTGFVVREAQIEEDLGAGFGGILRLGKMLDGEDPLLLLGGCQAAVELCLGLRRQRVLGAQQSGRRHAAQQNESALESGPHRDPPGTKRCARRLGRQLLSKR